MRRRFSRLQLWLEAQRDDLRPLLRAEMDDASRAIALLPPHVTLYEAARYYAENHKAAADDTPFADAIAKYIESKRVALRPDTLHWYENIARNLSVAFESSGAQRLPSSPRTQ